MSLSSYSAQGKAVRKFRWAEVRKEYVWRKWEKTRRGNESKMRWKIKLHPQIS